MVVKDRANPASTVCSMTENTELSAEGNDPSIPNSFSGELDSNAPHGNTNHAAGEAIESIRIGSPFAVDPMAQIAKRQIEPFYDVGPVRYTAMGAVAASVMVLGFATAAAWWFPGGGALIAALGCVLSIFGMYSVFRLTSVALLALHLVLFVISYGRSIG
jgi:hypothetical protein